MRLISSLGTDVLLIPIKIIQAKDDGRLDSSAAQEIVRNDWIVIFLSRTNKLGERVNMKERMESRIT